MKVNNENIISFVLFRSQKNVSDRTGNEFKFIDTVSICVLYLALIMKQGGHFGLV